MLSLGRWPPTQAHPVPIATLDDRVWGYQERISGSFLELPWGSCAGCDIPGSRSILRLLGDLCQAKAGVKARSVRVSTLEETLALSKHRWFGLIRLAMQPQN